jgi:TPP-dependent pyruvate/acetoin dehydrogenase alpha subunit
MTIAVEQLIALYRMMVRIRRFEERVAELVEAKEIRTPCHLCIGQEAVATGVCAALRDADYLLGTHRSHGHYLAKGGEMRALMAEIFGKKDGCSRGRGGSMHLIALDKGILGTVPIVAGTIPLAVGAAMASSLRKEDRVSVAFFGDGAMEEGTFHESLNLAAIYRLPVIFVCENNLYASHLSLAERRVSDNLAQVADAHGVSSVRLDGNDVVAVLTAAQEAVARARARGGPSFLECRTYRWRGHVGPSWDMDVGAKRSGELKDWLAKDPLVTARATLQKNGVADSPLDRMESEVASEIQQALEFAYQSPYPDRSELMNYVYV